MLDLIYSLHICENFLVLKTNILVLVFAALLTDIIDDCPCLIKKTIRDYKGLFNINIGD